MSHFLFIRNEASIPLNLREVFSAPEQRLVIRQSPLDAQSALERSAFAAVLIYAERGTDELKRTLKDLRTIDSHVFTIALALEYDQEEENAAYEAGVDLYLAEPFSPQTLKRIIQKTGTSTIDERNLRTDKGSLPAPANESSTSSTLRTLRDLSHILTYSLDYKAFTEHFILKLRDHISFSRIGIFLESSAKQPVVKKANSSELECIASIGLPSDLVDCVQLSREVGIGLELSNSPRILHRDSSSKNRPFGPTSAAEKEFAILGCDIAIPISDREGSIGVAILSEPITGRSYSDDELELLYVLMEELGLAIRNSRLHTELARHGQLIENVLHSMTSGALVCGEDLQVLYANDAAKRFLRIGLSDTNRNIDFADLPQKLAEPIHLAVEKGETPEPFTIHTTEGEIYRISIFPFTQKNELVLLPRPTMVIVEDFTTIEAAKQKAVDNTKFGVISLIAERFAHEIRNSLVPLSTHAQLIEKKIKQPKFQASLKNALLKETARIERFSEQMLYMAGDSAAGNKELKPTELVKNSFDRARGQLGNISANLSLNDKSEGLRILGNEDALTHVMVELFVNSMQAQPIESTIHVDLSASNESMLLIRLRDEGPGIDREVLNEATEPFFTTRNTGVGLGLSVAQKIIGEHNGIITLHSKSSRESWDLEIELPLLLTST